MTKKNSISRTKSVAKNIKKSTVEEPKLSLSISLNDETQEVTGKTVVELMSKIKFPDFPATPAVLIFKTKKDALNIYLAIPHIRRYIMNENSKAFFHDDWQKQINSL